MKSFRRQVVASLLAAGAVLGAGSAWANTELVPASRLVAPYWDISGDRSTLMFIANVSRRANLVKGTSAADLKGTCNLGAALPGTNCAVHLEFYDKTCVNVDLTIDLTRQDIDQLDLKTDTDLGGVRGLPSGLGWLDADVRKAITGSGHTNTSVQANVLTGTVVITDSGSDFAVAYPMAADIGSANSGVGGDIVSRDINGNANVWTGGFETFPARVFVPMFFAEGSNHGKTFTSTLAIAGPAQAVAGGEAPGQDLKDDPLTVLREDILIDAPVDVIDACENAQSDHLTAHYVFGTLDELFIQQVTAPFNTTCTYPAADVDRPATTAANAFAGGYIDITNQALGRACAAGTCLDGVSNLDERGLVGVLVQQTTSTGDATRLWGDCSFPDGVTAAASTANPGIGGCRTDFTLVDAVSHGDLAP